MNWYYAQDEPRSVHEVVLEATEPRPVDSKFGMLFLGGKYHVLRSSPWVTGFFRLESDPGPYLLVRADGYADPLKNQPFRVAFCFYRMQAGGLFAVFVDFPKLKLSGVPSKSFVLFEMIRGLDLDDERERIQSALACSQLHICFAEGDGPGEEVGEGWMGSSINACYDVLIDIDTGCHEILDREWRALLEYHDSMVRVRRDYEASLQQLQEENPLTHNPIVDRLRILKSTLTQEGATSGGRAPTEQGAQESTKWDTFICHASEDKDELVRPLALALRAKGLRVWYDEFTLRLGDSLRRSIDRGLTQSKFGIVVLSQAFFRKEWPQYELDGLAQREKDGVKVILPLWHNVTRDEIVQYSPSLADRVASKVSDGWEGVIASIIAVIYDDRQPLAASMVYPPANERDRRLKASDPISRSIDELIAILNQRAEKIIKGLRMQYPNVDLSSYIKEFLDLHIKHIAALESRQFVHAHEILNEIHNLSYHLESQEAPLHLEPGRDYAMLSTAFTTGPLICAYMTGDLRRDSPRYKGSKLLIWGDPGLPDSAVGYSDSIPRYLRIFR